MMGSAVSGAMFGYGGAPCEIIVNLEKIEGRKSSTMRDRNRQTYKAPVFMVSPLKMSCEYLQDGEDVKGTI